MSYTFPFCPWKGCRYHTTHLPGPYTAFRPWGYYWTKTFGQVPRFRCFGCGRTFSTQTFSVDYYAKRIISYPDLLQRLGSCESLSAMGRAFSASTDSVSNRISRASRQSLAFLAQLTLDPTASEQLVADGFESFCVSQYFPNNIQILVGSDSQYVYQIDYATIRRKGRMTKAQKLRRAELEGEYRAEPDAVEHSFSRLMETSLRFLAAAVRPQVELWTDKHSAYPRAIASSPCARGLLEQGRLRHYTVSSRAARTIHNPLFSVNYLDREIRKDLHEHVRESVCFGRNVNRQMERLSLYRYYHNIEKVHRAAWGCFSHAVVAGINAAEIERAKKLLWKRRAFLSLIELDPSAEDTWLRRWQTPVRQGPDYLPAYAAA